MDYSNESFERFQKIMESAVEKDSLLWLLRDAIFAEAFYGKQRTLAPLYPLPGGWMVALGYQWFQARRMKRTWSLPETAEGSQHFLFLSERNNHTARLFPLFREQREQARCIAWHTVPAIRYLAQNDEQADFHCIAGRWSQHLRLQDLRDANQLAGELTRIFPKELDRPAQAAIRIYLAQLLAWEHFWQTTLGEHPAKVVSTFEKASDVKSFFLAAMRKQTPSRIHWIHGLRHTSLQATLSTELWCMTPGDARFFLGRVPAACTPSVRCNPEAEALVQSIGMPDLNSLPQCKPIHFLFLGPGLEASYTREMRRADLRVIRKIQLELNERVQWRFRPHPSAAARFKAELAEAGVTADDFSTSPLNEDLRWSHAVGSSWSSLLLDVRETGRPIFWVQAEIRTLGAVDELIADGIGVHLDLEHGVERLMETVGRGGPAAPISPSSAGG